MFNKRTIILSSYIYYTSELSWLVMGPDQKILTRVGSGQFFVARVGRVSHLWFGIEFQKFPLKMSNFSIFFPSGQKNLLWSGRKVPGSKPGQPLIYCGSKVSSGRVGSEPISNHDTYVWDTHLHQVSCLTSGGSLIHVWYRYPD